MTEKPSIEPSNLLFFKKNSSFGHGAHQSGSIDIDSVNSGLHFQVLFIDM